MKLLPEFIAFNVAQNLFNKGSKLIVACSGGCDSVVLAHLLHQANIQIVLAHCNFQLRGEEANEDEKFVKEFAKAMNIPFHVIHFETEKFATENKLSIQQAARQLRYEWFEQLRIELKFDGIATAHHLNDSIETVFINLVRGTGIAGMTGIAAKNEKIIRPLLFANRNTIENYAAENNLNFRTDSSNHSDDYLRNKIRHHLIPLLNEMNPAFEKTMQKNIQHFEQTEQLYQTEWKKKLKKIVQQKNDEYWIAVKPLLHLPAASTILTEALKPFGFNTSQAEDIFNNLEAQSGTTYLSQDFRLIKHKDFWIVSNKTAQKNSIIVVEQNQSKSATTFGDFHFEILDWNNDSKISTDANIALLDARNIAFPLCIRAWQQGDYFYPLGMKRKKKKLSDFFIQQKLSLPQKEKVQLVCMNDYIIWIAGMRVDERFKITATTKKILKITFTAKNIR